MLAAMGALRAGAGLVTVACPRGIEPTLKSGYPDVMTMPLGDGESWNAAMASTLIERLPQFDAVVLGPGIGRDAGASDFLSALVPAFAKGRSGSKTKSAPGVTPHTDGNGGLPHFVLDADALFWLADNPGALPGAVITPHPGEAARLLGKSISEVEADRLETVRELATRLGAAAVLKGPGTVICQASGPTPQVFVSPFAEPNLAVGGSGDVLSGIIGSLLARNLSPLLAACLGVYWHGLAGRLVSGEFPYRGNLASEIVQALPRALTEWLDAES